MTKSITNKQATLLWMYISSVLPYPSKGEYVVCMQKQSQGDPTRKDKMDFFYFARAVYDRTDSKGEYVEPETHIKRHVKVVSKTLTWNDADLQDAFSWTLQDLDTEMAGFDKGTKVKHIGPGRFNALPNPADSRYD